MAAQNKKIGNELFICYSRQDSYWENRLKTALSTLDSNLNVWSDKKIRPGQFWLVEIAEAIARAKVALLLVSHDFIRSSFIETFELPQIWEAQRKGLQILWVPVKRTIWEDTAFRHIQSTINPERWLTEATPKTRNKLVAEICQKVKDALEHPHAQKRRRPSRPSPTDVVPVAISREDVDRSRSAAKTLRLTFDNYLQILLHQAVTEEGMKVMQRNQSEVRGQDMLLRAASEARFIALTYKTLGLAFNRGKLRLLRLAEADIAVYALPILEKWHPTLRDSPRKLRREWLNGVSQVLTALTDSRLTPQIRRLDLRIINRIPTFTASVLTSKSDNGSSLRIRYTPVLESEELVATPTINLTLNLADGAEPNPAFSAFARIVDNMQSRSRPLVFPILRRSPSHFVLKDIEDFVERLMSTTNHLDYSLPDSLFHVRIRVENSVADQCGLGRALDSGGTISAEEVYRVFDYMRGKDRSHEFCVTANMRSRSAVIEAGRPGAAYWKDSAVSQEHVLGVFALLTKCVGQEQVVYLKQKPKPNWDYDVPGGKVAQPDASIIDTLDRELFEELGIRIPSERLGKPIAAKYDPKGALTQTPVIALYFHCELSEEECHYLDDVLPTATDGYPIEPMDLEALIKQKEDARQVLGYPIPVAKADHAEAVCHATLESLRSLRHGAGAKA